MNVPGTLRAGGAAFATTHWTLVAGSAENHDLLAQLCRDYWPPLYSFVRRRGYSSDDAQDLVQGFFAYFLRTGAYTQTDRTKGKFRTFLLASIKHYIADVWDREQTLKRGGACEFVLLESEMEAAEKKWTREFAPAALPEEQLYEQSWADALVTRALHRLEKETQAEAKEKLFSELKPFLCGGSNLPRQEQIAERLAMPLETLRSHLSRLRARYRILLRDEVKRTVSPTDSVDEELRHLCSILATAG